MSLADKIRKAREQVVPLGDFKFTIRRPTDVEMLELQGSSSVSRLFKFIVGWEGVKELDIIAGGDPHPLAFDAEACREWLEDRPDLLGPVVSTIVGSYSRHTEALEAAAKN
jgi:hypothetical protein